MTLRETVEQMLNSWSPETMPGMAATMSHSEVLTLSSLLAWADRPDLAEALLAAAWKDGATPA
jgi:hypothetical protein